MRLDLDTWRLTDLDPDVVPKLKVNVWTPVFRRDTPVSVSLDAVFGDRAGIKLASQDTPIYWKVQPARQSGEALKALLLDNDFPQLWASWVNQARAEKVAELREAAAKYGYKLVKA